ncbi:30S ribosomal protein S16 [bacterium]|nr:30S ribosomal protein S16 [bacterium]
MLSIRLTRVGKKKQPIYRVIVLDKRKDPWGKFIENLGNYNPRTNPRTINLKIDRIKYWLSVGAQPSATVHNFLVDEKIIDAKKIKTTIVKKKAKGKEEKNPPAGGKKDDNKENKQEDKKEDSPAGEKEKEVKKDDSENKNKEEDKK